MVHLTEIAEWGPAQAEAMAKYLNEQAKIPLLREDNPRVWWFSAPMRLRYPFKRPVEAEGAD